MQTGNTKYTDVAANRAYYQKSDGHYMPLQNCKQAHKVIDRIAWLVEKVHQLDGRTHIAVGCFLKGTQITMSDYSTKSIELIKKGDTIISAENNFRNVTSIMTRKYDGLLYSLKSKYGFSLTATEEHPILIMKANRLICPHTGRKGYRNICNYVDNKCSKCGGMAWDRKPEYVPICDVLKGDYVAIPRMLNAEHTKLSKEDIARYILYGWYLAEGSVTKSRNKGVSGLCFSLCIDEEKEIREIERSLKVLGIESSISYRPKKSIIEIRTRGGKVLANEFVNKLGKGAWNKFISKELFQVSNEAKVLMLSRLFKGDGYFRKQKNGGYQYILSTVSDQLALDVKSLLTILGVPVYLYRYEKTGLKMVVLSGVDVKILRKTNYSYTSKSIKRVTDDYIYLPVEETFVSKYKGNVYNFSVEGDESYIAEGIGVHNCKDGYECMTLQAMGVDCIGIDPSEDSILEARHKADQLGFDGRKMFKKGFAEDIPEGVHADTVSCLEVIEHVVDDRKLLEILSRMGTYVLISTPDANGRHGLEDAKRNEEHVRLYTQEELEKLVSEFGEIKESVVRDSQICILYKPR